jgi:hypothetical protein
MLRDTLVVEPYAGPTGAGGPSFGAPLDPAPRAHVEPKRRMVRTVDGEQVVTAAVAYLRPGPVIPPRSRVTWKGRTLSVLTDGEMRDMYLELNLGGAGEGAMS